jgi:hypothetical protein
VSTLDRIAAHLTALGLRYRATDDGLILIAFTGFNTRYEAAIEACGPLVRVVSPAVSMIPGARLDETIRVVNLVNATRVMFGGFWVDPGQARVAFELALAVPDGPTVDQVDLAMSALTQIDACFPILASVIWGGMTAERALLSAGARQPPDEPPALDVAV